MTAFAAALKRHPLRKAKEHKLLKRAAIGAVLLLGSWGWSSAMAAITITTDSAFQLSGSFSALGGGGDFETVSTSTFGSSLNQLLPGVPGGDNFNLLRLGRLDSDTKRSLIFQTAGGGTPNDPSFSFSISLPDNAPRTFPDVSGMYNNNPSSTAVYFLFSNLADSVGVFGSFSGDFAFSTSPLSPIPEPEIYAMMMTGLDLIGFMARRKRKLQASADGR